MEEWTISHKKYHLTKEVHSCFFLTHKTGTLTYGNSSQNYDNRFECFGIHFFINQNALYTQKGRLASYLVLDILRSETHRKCIELKIHKSEDF